jgi:hypothetical protein
MALNLYRRADVRFSNRPIGVKRFQTIHHHSVDVARGLVLLFGIGTRALPSWDSRTKIARLRGIMKAIVATIALSSTYPHASEPPRHQVPSSGADTNHHSGRRPASDDEECRSARLSATLLASSAAFHRPRDTNALNRATDGSMAVRRPGSCGLSGSPLANGMTRTSWSGYSLRQARREFDA